MSMMDSNRLYLGHLLEDCNFGVSVSDSLDYSTNTVLSMDGDLFGLIPLNGILHSDIDNPTTARMNNMPDPDFQVYAPKNKINGIIKYLDK